MIRLFPATALIAALTFSAHAQTPTAPNPLRRPATTTTTIMTAAPEAPAEKETPKRRAKSGKSKSTGDYAERRKRCSGEWSAAKAANSTGGKKWPQFFSACNTRLKAAGV